MGLVHDRHFTGLLVAALGGLACSSPVGSDRPSVPAPRAEDVLTFPGISASPLEGELRILPPRWEDGWTYRVDLDGDGVDDGAGPVALGISHFYHFEAVGARRIRIDMEKDGASFETSRTVHVSDPGMLEDLGLSKVTEALIGRGLTGIALSPDEEVLYVSSHSGVAALGVTDLSVLWSFVLNTGPGFDDSAIALSPDGHLLFAAVGDSIYRVDLRGDGSLVSLGSLTGLRHIELAGDGSVVISTRAGIDVLDPVDGTVRVSWPASEFAPFAGSPAEGVLYVLAGGTSPRALALDSGTLEEIWSVSLPSAVEAPQAAYYDRERSRLYALVNTRESVDLLTIDTVQGVVLTDTPLGNPMVTYSGVSSPGAATSDGRYLLLATYQAPYVVDLETGLPIHVVEDLGPGCCNVVYSSSSDLFLIANHDGDSVSKIRLRR
jgi:DNA-binding beta-propeller fold protein YncE